MVLGKETLRKIFVDSSGVLTNEDFDAIVVSAAESRLPLEQILMERGFVAPNHFLTLLSNYFKVPSTDLKISSIDGKALELIPEKFAVSHLVVPFQIEGDVLRVAMANPAEHDSLTTLKLTGGLKIETYVSTEQAIKRALVLYRGSMSSTLDALVADIKQQAQEGKIETPSITAFLTAVIENAVLCAASDIHIEPYEHEGIIRFRVDGLLQSAALYPHSIHDEIVARLKNLATLKIDEKRLPQDGRFSQKVQDEEINIRLSLAPSMWGEKAVMRVLHKEAELFDLGNLGFLDSDLPILRKYLKSPFGMILVTGPTGSGKTSTLYSFIQDIGMERIDVVNISTVEDPIEYTMPRVTQIQVHPEIDLTFASGLRSLLRQDPDILMVGEIRDKETAGIAVQAALVGRLLLSSLHTNDAVGVIPRLIDMEVEPYAVASTLSMVVAQRLVRKLCPHCRSSYIPDAHVLHTLSINHDMDYALGVLKKIQIISETSTLETLRFYQSKGCEKCENSGYIGRTAVFEILEVQDELRELISTKESGVKIKEHLKEKGMKTLFIDGLAKVILGTTDLAELERVTI